MTPKSKFNHRVSPSRVHSKRALSNFVFKISNKIVAVVVLLALFATFTGWSNCAVASAGTSCQGNCYNSKNGTCAKKQGDCTTAKSPCNKSSGDKVPCSTSCPLFLCNIAVESPAFVFHHPFPQAAHYPPFVTQFYTDPLQRQIIRPPIA